MNRMQVWTPNYTDADHLAANATCKQKAQGWQSLGFETEISLMLVVESGLLLHPNRAHRLGQLSVALVERAQTQLDAQAGLQGVHLDQHQAACFRGAALRGAK